ncbi:hypothetical protein GCK72_009033 [Caenorhabditis remanei]|uniref:Sdz-33 F-box domain-containing protein n=1 Tax=Caenorhabditis remanei TaxID=31234 RepID=A0A6A5H2F9_CAERE|nr:hypothetical protein GCK72_009033 [Caenorhabditis remanei]KAF1760783.1 hypothetical protein GCK72_009033 [Caenorhabditis remanei]
MLFLNSNASIEQMSAVAEWTKSLFSECWFCHIAGDDANSETFELNHEYEIAPIDCGVLNAQEVLIYSKPTKYPVNWFTLEQTMRSNWTKLMFGACTFDASDLNQFIKGWLNGNNSKMEVFRAVVKPYIRDLVLDGIEYEERDITERRRPYNTSFFNNAFNSYFIGGYYIRRNDGTVASIQEDFKYLGPQIMIIFTFVVWPQDSS